MTLLKEERPSTGDGDQGSTRPRPLHSGAMFVTGDDRNCTDASPRSIRQSRKTCSSLCVTYHFHRRPTDDKSLFVDGNDVLVFYLDFHAGLKLRLSALRRLKLERFSRATVKSRPIWTICLKIHAFGLSVSLGSPWHVANWLVVGVTGLRILLKLNEIVTEPTAAKTFV